MLLGQLKIGAFTNELFVLTTTVKGCIIGGIKKAKGEKTFIGF